jgi:hypothetical protein
VTTKAKLYKPQKPNKNMESIPIKSNIRKAFIAIIFGIMTVIIAILLTTLLNFNLVQNLVMAWILTALFAIFAFFLIDPKIKANPIQYVEKPIKEEIIKIVEKPVYVDKEIIKVVEKPIIKEVQVPIENKVIEVIEKPVYIDREVIREVPVDREVIRTIRTQSPKKTNLNIPKFEFIGSTQTRKYHRRNCKFIKMLKKKYKLHSNNKMFFKKKHYKACKTCIKKKK